jgi:hypothetical protein
MPLTAPAFRPTLLLASMDNADVINLLHIPVGRWRGASTRSNFESKRSKSAWTGSQRRATRRWGRQHFCSRKWSPFLWRGARRELPRVHILHGTSE